MDNGLPSLASVSPPPSLSLSAVALMSADGKAGFGGGLGSRKSWGNGQ